MFKVGDKVKRVSGGYFGMMAGDTGVVTEVHPALGIKLDKWPSDVGYHDETKFVKVNTFKGNKQEISHE